MDISYDYYRIFYYVAKLGNLSLAAKQLVNSQPNLTRAIKNLESQLGCPLFIRTNRGMKLTSDGEKLYAHVRIAFEHIEAGEAEITGSNGTHNGTVFVASSEVALRCLLLPILKEYRLLHPGVRIRISNHSTPQAITALKEGIADLAVVTTPISHCASLVEQSLMKIREVPVCSPALGDFNGRKVPLAELQNYSLISLSAATKSFEFYSAFFAKHGLLYQPDIEASTADQILPMVEADLGIGFVPEQFLSKSDALTVIDLQEEIPYRSICLVKRKEQALSLAARALEQMILDARS